MRTLRNVIRKISTHFPWNKYTVRSVDDIPDYPAPRIIYTIGSIEDSWLLFFRCPCRCGKDIYLNLLEDDSPRWSFRITDRRISIAPSVHGLKGCKSHFWIKKGRVIWCFY